MQESEKPKGLRTSPRYRHDVFISHASEDKEKAARPLAEALANRGVDVWFDESSLTLGDSLRRKIDEGLKQCRFGVVVLSPSFFRKDWPQRELDALAARETSGGRKVILPVWHNVSLRDVIEFSPTLADRLAVNTLMGIEAIADAIMRQLPRRTRTVTSDHDPRIAAGRKYSLVVVKSDLRRQEWDRDRLRRSLMLAFNGRMIGAARFNELVAELERELHLASGAEVASSKIAELVMAKLQSIDQTAYIRYAAMYRAFADVKGFEDEVRRLIDKANVRTSPK